MSRHKQKLHGTNKLRHQRKVHGKTEILTAVVIFATEVNDTSDYSVARNMAESVEPDDDFELGEEDEDSEESFIIRYYYSRGLEYKEIFLLLLKNHNIEMSLSTLKRRIKSCLRRQRPD